MKLVPDSPDLHEHVDMFCDQSKPYLLICTRADGGIGCVGNSSPRETRELISALRDLRPELFTS